MIQNQGCICLEGCTSIIRWNLEPLLTVNNPCGSSQAHCKASILRLSLCNVSIFSPGFSVMSRPQKQSRMDSCRPSCSKTHFLFMRALLSPEMKKSCHLCSSWSSSSLTSFLRDSFLPGHPLKRKGHPKVARPPLWSLGLMLQSPGCLQCKLRVESSSLSALGLPASGLWTCQISSSISLEIKCTIYVIH